MSTVEPITAWATTRRALAEAMAQIDGLLPGSVVRRHIRCGKAGCACTAEPPTLHGPYIQWTRTVNGKTVTRYLSEEQLARYQPWFDNSRLLKNIIAKLEVASLHAVEQSERQPAKPTRAKATAGKDRSTRPSGL